MRTDNPVALVTGASRGIGRSIALALAHEGFEVWINYRNNHVAAEEVSSQIRDCGGRSLLLPFDVSDSEAARRVIEPLLTQRPVHSLILNAGVAQRGPTHSLSEGLVRQTLAVNLESLFSLVRLVLRGMIKARDGRIVAIGSIAGARGLPGQACYAASKAGMVAAIRSLAQEVGRYNILANSVEPGWIDTDMSRAGPTPPLSSVPLGRPGTPKEVAEVVAFLCSERATYINGTVIAVDGGLV